MSEYILRGPYTIDFGMRGIDVPPYTELPSPLKPREIQISVCLTTWRRPKHIIKTSVESIFNQSFPPEAYEVILVDDASEGEFLDEYRSAVDELIREYPNHNFRTYHTHHTRCWNDPHTFNVAFKRALGWIVVMGQTDDLQRGEVLEAHWRHQHQLPNLGLCPEHFATKGDGSLLHWPHCYFPEEHALSIRKDHVHRVKGRNEGIRGMANTAIIDFLTSMPLVFAEDVSVSTIHRDIRSYRREGYNQQPELEPQFKRRPNGTWTDGDWGVLTPEEEKSVRMTEAMRKVLE